MNLFSCAETAELTEVVPEREIAGERHILELLRKGILDSGRRFHCRSESYILRLAYAYNKILSLSNSRTRILSHQVESTHRIVNSINHRFLIADEVGLGKTVEAGLVIKELMYRYDYKRILIACPASLIYQWQSEMKSKFNEHFEIMDRSLLKKAALTAGKDGNPWKVYNRIICSLDFIKNGAFAEDLAAVKWDAVVFDEAHRLRRDSNQATQAYTMAEGIARRTKALLLLSATPFRGKLEELYYLIGLLDKNILGPFQSFCQEYCMEGSDTSSLKDRLSEVVIRRTKRDIGGFTRRYAKTIQFDLYADERCLYDETTRYVVEEFNRAMQTENRAVGFVMTVFQKLLDSSSYALLSALRKRHARLEEMVRRTEMCENSVLDFLAEEDTGEEADFDNELIAEHVEKTVEELKLEISTIGRLIALAENIKVNKKSEKLLELIASLKKKGRRKFLIFTQFRTTQDYLAQVLSGYKTVVFNGSMNGDEKEKAILDFKNDAEILIATEAGGEGRNMQFCSILINYDLPWSPLKVEQRIGRIHRFGQTSDVLIYNFSTAGTVAERVLDVLGHKLKLFEDSLGAPDIMLGEIEDELSLNSLFMEYAAGSRKKKDVEEEIQQRINTARENYEKLSELTVSGRMDFNYDEYYRITMKERQFSNRRIERFINMLQEEDGEYCSSLLGAKKTAGGLYHVKCSGKGKSKYGTFDSQTALENENLDFLAFGHPVIDRLMAYAGSMEFGGLTGAKTVKAGRPCTGMLFNYTVSFRSVRETKELIPVVVPLSGSMSEQEISSLERASMEADADVCDPDRMKELIRIVAPSTDRLAASARERLEKKISRRISEISDELDFNLDPEIEKIRTSYDRSIRELEEKLELLQSRQKWYGGDLRGVITRTSNKILKTRQEKEHWLLKYRGYMGIKTSVEMVNAGFITGKPSF